MERMIIKHLTGSKANQVEEFALKHHNELIFGRETNSTVKYDPDRDDLVGRQHAKIQKDPNNANGFIISDLSSRNGTFVNSVKLTGPTMITPGDVVQFGPDGPKFQFDVEPRPMNATKPTRIAEVGKTAPETRVTPNQAPAPTPMNIPVGNDSVPTHVVPKAGIGKATVERMISDRVEETKQQEGKKFAAVGGAAAFIGLLLIGSLAFGGYYYNSKLKTDTQQQMDAKSEEINQKTKDLEAKNIEAQKKLEETQKNSGGGSSNLNAANVAEKNGKSVVYIEGSWQLTNKTSKSQIYHRFIPNSREYLTGIYKVNYGKGPIIPNGPTAIPIYNKVGNSYEPVLTDVKDDYSFPIGGSYSGSGFIVTSDGYILTNRHIASPFRAMHSFPQNYPLGVLLDENGQIAGAGVEPPINWIPENTKAVGKQFQGQFDDVMKLKVMLPGNEIPVDAQFINVSPRADVGMIKINVPGDLPKVEIYDQFDQLKKGEEIVIMGYPAGAPVVYKLNFSKDMLNPEGKTTIIPDPTVSTSSIGNIVKSEMKDLENLRASDQGDSIRYAVSLTGHGNSGGPVFDIQGRVIGIHFAGDEKQAGFAVPIKFGMQLFPNYTKSGS
jgi:serine protease Do